MTNTNFKLKAIGDLLNGDYMFIPSYQRGYRWTESQVKELLSDLLSFAYSCTDQKSYYCLQPIVAKNITESDLGMKLLAEGNDSNSGKKVWEIVDGQQRLTTIFIIYRYLMKKSGLDEQSLYEEYERTLYKVIYQTRKDSSSFLNNIGDATFVDENIDYFHMSSTYKSIDEWIQNEAKTISVRYKKDTAPRRVRDVLMELLNAQMDKNNNYGSTQVLWYELDSNSNVIEEFRNLNAGKIYLTDAELVKALFLKKQKSVSENEQLERAMKWESIENELHNNDFWYFLNPLNYNIPNRIDFIFQLIHKTEVLRDITEDDEEKCIEALDNCNKDLGIKNFIFNKYYEKFDIDDENERNKVWETEWGVIEQTFEDLRDWREDALCYNLIGLLCQFSTDQLAICYAHYKKMDASSSKDEFIEYLEGKIAKHMSKVKGSPENGGTIMLKYSDPMVKNTLLLLNVLQLNRQIVMYKEDCKAKNVNPEKDVLKSYSFPFSVLSNVSWDVEHIDSATANNLHDVKDQELWINTTIEDIKLTNDQIEEVQRLRERNRVDAINYLRDLAGEQDASSDIKDHISNLTLLDTKTNRSYKNALFVTKRKRIINNMKCGTYVLPITMYVFAKLFDDSGTNRTRWTENDMKKYDNFMFEELKSYISVE